MPIANAGGAPGRQWRGVSEAEEEEEEELLAAEDDEDALPEVEAALHLFFSGSSEERARDPCATTCERLVVSGAALLHF